MKILVLLLLAHSWYPRECCTERDCKPVPCDFAEGALIAPRGEKVKVLIYRENDKDYYAETKLVRPSLDDQCHVCIQPGTLNMRCVFIPVRVS